MAIAPRPLKQPVVVPNGTLLTLAKSLPSTPLKHNPTLGTPLKV